PQNPDNDAALAAAFARHGAVIPGMFFFTSPDEIRHLENDTPPRTSLAKSRILRVFDDSETGEFPQLLTPLGVNANIPLIEQSGAGTGYFNVVPDMDGVIRRIPLVCRYQDDFYPALSLKTVSAFTGKPLKLMLNDAGISQLSAGEIVPPIGTAGRMLINYTGPAYTIPHISASDVLDGTADNESIAGKIVIIGVTATGLYDIRLTPFETVYPGVEIHANVVDNLLTGRYLREPWWNVPALLAALIVLTVALSTILVRVRALYGALVAAVLFCGVLGVSFCFFYAYRLWIPPAILLTLIAVLSSAVSLLKFMREEQERRFIKGAFGQYLSPHLVDELVHNPKLLTLGGEEKVLTVLFTDIAGFTRISESIPPTELVTRLNEYTTLMSDIILERNGTIDKYIGDAIMAFFGAPVEMADHSEKACAAAILMQRALTELNTRWETEGKPPFDTRIGIHTGKMVVGNMGSRNKFNYTVLGDSVNLGARLEGANKFYGTGIIVSEAVTRQIGYQFITRMLDRVKVVGKEKAVAIYELLGFSDSDSARFAAFLQEYNKGLELFYARDWKKAAARFKQARILKPHDRPSYILLERCESYLAIPPADDWDGTFQFTSK
ncbi:CHASE2 domain-containing protein, partial [bacterium]|nr:CHASE2 domain-containing protein [bacterium]